MMDDKMYLLDNNVLSHLSRSQRASSFFLGKCRLPAEVVYEARDYPDSSAFAAVEYPTTVRVLELLREVMATVPDDDTALVNLYANKGAADPLLLACALHGAEEATEQLWGPRWVIVSSDKAVRSKAAALEIESLSREDFLILANEHQ